MDICEKEQTQGAYENMILCDTKLCATTQFLKKGSNIFLSITSTSSWNTDKDQSLSNDLYFMSGVSSCK